jgi:transcriptional regulator with XRE-family HTH domain
MASILEQYGEDRARRNETPTPETIEVGMRFRHGRRQAGISQRRLADRSGVSQSEISRLERGMTPGMSAYRVFAIALALGDQFPFGVCPHPHRCAYRNPSPNDRGTRRGIIDLTRDDDPELIAPADSPQGF